MEPAEHLTALLTEGRMFSNGVANAVDRVGWDAEVPPCPDWTVRDLVVHLGGVHRWVTAFVVDERTEPTSREERAAFGEHPHDEHLADWFDAGLEGVADAIARADPALRCWTLWPGLPPRSFWARRMAHETLVHRLDAEIVAGGIDDLTRVDPALAADGIDELVREFLPVRARRRLVADPPRAVAIEATDTGDLPDLPGRWSMAITPDGPVPDVADDPALTLRGTAEHLHRMLWNRDRDLAHGVEIVGDTAVLELWRAGARV